MNFSADYAVGGNNGGAVMLPASRTKTWATLPVIVTASTANGGSMVASPSNPLRRKPAAEHARAATDVEDAAGSDLMENGFVVVEIATVTVDLVVDRRKARVIEDPVSRWMWSIPVLLFIGAIANLATTKWGEIDGVASYALWLALGTLLIGFSEELLTRGLAIVGGRGSMHEKWVWVFSGTIFGLLHVPNAFLGQSVRSTAQQVVFAFAVGLMYYVTRRITGTLVVTMGLHAVWDFSVFIQDHSVMNLDDKPIAAGGPLLSVTIVLGIIALVKILRTGDVVAPGGDQLAEFDQPTALQTVA